MVGQRCHESVLDLKPVTTGVERKLQEGSTADTDIRLQVCKVHIVHCLHCRGCSRGSDRIWPFSSQMAADLDCASVWH